LDLKLAEAILVSACKRWCPEADRGCTAATIGAFPVTHEISS